MHKGRVEAFSDGVIAIIITIMVLELRPPENGDWHELVHSGLLSYVLSFVFVAIYWNNHHHMFQAVKQVNGRILWANAHLLFWLSLIPFVTSWMEEHHFDGNSVMAYGVVLLMCAVAFTILVKSLLRHHGPESTIARAIGSDVKGYTSLALYVAAIVAATFAPNVSLGIYVLTAMMWLVPDTRFEHALHAEEQR